MCIRLRGGHFPNTVSLNTIASPTTAAHGAPVTHLGWSVTGTHLILRES